MNKSKKNEITSSSVVKNLFTGGFWGVVLFSLGVAALLAIFNAWSL